MCHISRKAPSSSYLPKSRRGSSSLFYSWSRSTLGSTGRWMVELRHSRGDGWRWKKKENEDRYTLRCFWGGEDSTGRRSHHGHFGGTAWDDVPVRRGGVSTGNGRNAFSVRKGGNDVIAEKWC